jgi:hypothetical protein
MNRLTQPYAWQIVSNLFLAFLGTLYVQNPAVLNIIAYKGN